ncbi:hypothetical protein F6X53_30905 [Methylobacterium soli]|uniref:Uncharacterized protein n=1 Tax=Methylobacterium soli TaxID=553447 RepID=A0A6L3SVA3_9HYPH|nr:hypothetical protein F6X53_30905 [Methylobacterium soli]
MAEANQTAYIVHVSFLDEEVSRVPLVAFYAALTETPERAVALVRQAVKSGAAVTLMDARLSQSTAQAIGLMPDIAMAL